MEEQAFAGERLCELVSGSTALDPGGQGSIPARQAWQTRFVLCLPHPEMRPVLFSVSG
ncbi:hypothetical protein V1T76_03670 [Roseibium sp. FZY0029]|uniref:hypothetical protein n=1 Tax=Roseibium sp. FZY0029 TaxID=3116647 RepID=UPI002EBC21A4|nr:hypothetical protein [Roseibium sp. FZY0029]